MGEKRVLIVDDNPSDRKIVKLVAEKNGFWRPKSKKVQGSRSAE